MKHLKLLALSLVLLSGSCVKESVQEEELLNAQFATTKSGSNCNTAFAKGDNSKSTCFLQDGFRRWGWSIGPLSPGEYTFPIYAGAGRCDVEKGTLAGTLEVNFNESANTVDVSYVANNGFEFTETHLYIGNTTYPMLKKGKRVRATVAPGKYPYQHTNLVDRKNDDYNITDINEKKIYIIAHAVTCEVPMDVIEEPVDDIPVDEPVDEPVNPEAECLPCAGEVNSLTFQYASLAPGEVKVIQSDGTEIFNGLVQGYEEFTFSGTQENGSMGSFIQIFLDGNLISFQDTSCATPIGTNMFIGPFIITKGSSTLGNALCESINSPK